MKKGFTLVELLVVVVVIITLMGVAFRVGSAGSTATKISKTVERLQKVENCLSGYFAAYGSYPPVPLHGSRDYTLKANHYGIQKIDNDEHWTGKLDDGDNWKKSIEAACRSQPVSFEFPYPPGARSTIRKISDALRKKAMSSDSRNKKYRDNPALLVGFEALTDNSMISGKGSKPEWKDTQVCKLGLMSYLLPRVLVLFDAKIGANFDNSYFDILEDQRQWSSNNELPVDFDTGQPFGSWEDVYKEMTEKKKFWKIALQPSQMVCARWLPNLAGIVAGAATEPLYGVKLHDEKTGTFGLSPDNPNPVLYSAGTQQGGDTLTQQYILRKMTIRDEWGNDLYYYSLPPHQSYVLWSSGPDGRTFPPWIPDEELATMDEADRKTALKWMSDDIVHMKN